MSSAASPQQLLPQRLFTFTVKNAAMLFASIYAAGFLVTSLYQARFGLETLEPLKPRVFSSGVLFVVLAGLPCLAMARAGGLFGLKPPGRTYVVSGSGTKYVKLVWALDFWWIAVGLRIISAIVFAPFEMFPGYPGWLFYILFCAVWAAISFYCDLNKRPVTTVAIHLAFFLLGILIIHRYMSPQFLVHVLWFYFVGVVFLWLHFISTSGEFASTHDWERDVFFMLALLLFFAKYVYRDVYPAYGGGKPIPVDIRFTKANSFSTGSEAGGFLVDQDGRGYYLIHSENETSAVFVPADAVSGLVFHGRDNKI